MCDFIIQIFEVPFADEDKRFGYRVLDKNNIVVADGMGYKYPGAATRAAEKDIIEIEKGNNHKIEGRVKGDIIRKYTCTIVRSGPPESKDIEVDIKRAVEREVVINIKRK